jgi:hypothetical protein
MIGLVKAEAVAMQAVISMSTCSQTTFVSTYQGLMIESVKGTTS